MSSNEASGNDEKTGTSKGLIGSAVVVAAIVLLGLVVSLTNLIGGKDEQQPPAQAATTSSAATGTANPSAPDDASVCGLTDVKPTGAVSAPPEAMWALVGTIAAPRIDGQGPGNLQKNGFRDCYARTPTGALLAAANYIAVVSDPALTKDAVTKLVAESVGRNYALEHLRDVSPQPADLRMQIAGFKVLAYTEDRASVDLVFRTAPQPALVSQVVDVVWQAGDWKVQPSDTGGFLAPAHSIDSLSGYLVWSGA